MPSSQLGWVKFGLKQIRRSARRAYEQTEQAGGVQRGCERTAAVTARADSEFEKMVAARLIEVEYFVKPQWRVGYYRIDLVVQGNGKKIAVECDGDRYHPIDKLPEDMARQTVLERLAFEAASSSVDPKLR